MGHHATFDNPTKLIGSDKTQPLVYGIGYRTLPPTIEASCAVMTTIDDFKTRVLAYKPNEKVFFNQTPIEEIIGLDLAEAQWNHAVLCEKYHVNYPL